MPYWGASVENSNYLIQARVHGVETKPAPDDLVEYIANIASSMDPLHEYELAKFFATKIARAMADIPDVLWVTVDIILNGGALFGHTEIVRENI